METRELVEKVLLHKDINLLIKDNEFKLKGSGNRPSFELDPNGIKRFISRNIDYIEQKHNGTSQDIIALLAVKDDELKLSLDDIKSKPAPEVQFQDSKTMEYIQDLNKLIFTKATTEKDRVIIFNTKTDAIEEFHDIKTIETEYHRAYRFNPDVGKQEFSKWSEASEKYCVHTFHQNKEKLIPVNPQLRQWEFNNYTIPEYRKKADRGTDPKNIELISEYFKHLVPDPVQREYLFAWTYTTLKTRQETFLCLMGAHGVGKTFYMDLLSQLHGVTNAVRPKDPNSQFNAYLNSKSIVLYDEVQVTEKNKETFKRIANRIIQVEKKGIDQLDVVNTASICLASNYYYNLVVEPRDRRFSVPDLGTTPLEKAIGKRKTTKLFKLLDDDKFLFWFYDWLMRKFDGSKDVLTDGKYSPTTPLKLTKTFEICCNINATDEVRFTLKLMREREMDGTKKYKTLQMDELVKKYKTEQKKEATAYRRINKHSIFYTPEVFKDTMALYTIDGNPIITMLDEYTIQNNLALDELEETPVSSSTDPMD